MASRFATILALSSLALAHPRKHHHFGTGYGTGTGGGSARPTGGMPFPANGTDMGAGSPPGGIGSVPAISVTVQPLPESTGVAAPGFSSVPDFGQAASSGLPVEAASASASSCSFSTTTTTMTTMQYITVTASADSAPETGAKALSADSTASIVLTASVSAGQFYGRPSQSVSNGGGFSASASAVSTTIATMAPGTVPSAASSVALGSSAAPPASSSTTPSTGTSSGKKGLSYNTASLLSAFANEGMSFAYNWAATPDGTIPSGIEYVPMCWGLSSTGSWAAAASSAIASGSKHVLSFNEPDLSTQANIDPATAAKNHIKYISPFSGQAEIGSPAVTNGAGQSPLMGIDWLEQFFTECGTDCKIDFIAFHWYDSASNLAYFKKHVDDVVSFAKSKGISKVWLTEFGALGLDSDVAKFITEATAYLDGNSAVEKYAYFMASDGLLLSGSGLSTLGKAYVA